MEIYLAGNTIFPLYIAPMLYGGGFSGEKRMFRPFILESFYYVDEDTEKLLPYYGDFFLDSGAFTFMQNCKSTVNWEDYIERYSDFINRNKIEKFFELDIDSVVGYPQVLKFRDKLENLTGKKCIPVWHRSRGIQDFKDMCDAYPYVAIGGIVAGEIKSDQYGKFPAMIREAHKRGAKIHGLGFTSLDWLKKCHFDSVDSTSWTTGNRFGFAWQFDGKTMVKKNIPHGKKIADPRKLAINNYCEWVRFQEWAVTHL